MPNTNPLGSVVSLHRYPVKSMMGEELSTVEVGGRGLLGDRGYALIDSVDGKAATAKNPRKWPHLFAFGAALIAPGPASGGGTVRITLPDGTTVTSDQRDCNRILSKAVLRQNAGVIDTVDFRCRGARHLAAMMLTILRLLSLILAAFRLQSELALENLALRQQLAVVHRQHRRPRLRKSDRVFWLLLSRSWSHWKETLVIVKPETVLRWHRKRFASYWTRRSRRGRSGRPETDHEIRKLIRKMAESNPLWGAPRVHGELLKLGIDISERSVSRWMPRRTKPPSQNWRAFLDNHLGELVSIDFLTVPTATFRVLFVLIVLAHDRRKIVHFNVTEDPTAEWTAQQMVEAFCDGESARYLIRDRDAVYGLAFRDRVKALEIEEVRIAPHSPCQNPYAERVIGTLRRECLDHVIVLGETHLRRIVRSYVNYYHQSRTHLALGKDAPEPRSVQTPEEGMVIEMPEVGGLHHRYDRRAA